MSRSISRLGFAMMLVAAGSMSSDAQILTLGAGSTGHGIPVVPCTNQLILIYSNSCALIGQAWGE